MHKIVVYLILSVVWGLAGAASADLIGYWPFDGSLKDKVGSVDATFTGGDPTYVAGRRARL